MSVIEHRHRPAHAEEFCPVQPLQTVQAAGHMRNAAAISRRQSGRRDANRRSEGRGPLRRRLFRASLLLDVLDQAANLVGPSHFLLGFKTEIGLAEGVALGRHGHAFNIGCSEINSYGGHNDNNGRRLMLLLSSCQHNPPLDSLSPAESVPSLKRSIDPTSIFSWKT